MLYQYSFDKMKRKTITFVLVVWIPFALQAQRIDMDDFFGVNVFQCQESPEDIEDIATWIRDYTRWEYFEPVNNQFRFKNVIQDTARINYDAYYHNLKQHNIKSLFCVMRSPRWASSHKDSEKFDQYAPSGEKDGSDPSHYKEVAEFYYQLTSRYGSKQHPKKELLTDDKLSGLDLVDVVEVENEPDGLPSWGNLVTLKQYAALLNAAYDGNGGALGKGYGIKAADPDMPVSVGGLAFNLTALKEIVNLAGRQPFDIINVHFYTFKYVRESYRVAITPEWSSLEQDMKEIVAWRNANAPGKPVWLTEIGWDTKDYSTEIVSEQEAADYLIRSYLLALGAGVEKCFWFIMKDLDANRNRSPTVFSSSGLFENEGVKWSGDTRLKPKMTYWYNATFKKLLSGYVFDLNSFSTRADPTVFRYEFAHKDQRKRMIVAWFCPAEATRWIPVDQVLEKTNYTIELPEGWKADHVLRPVSGSVNGAPVKNTTTSTGVELTLTSTPVFIELSRK